MAICYLRVFRWKRIVASCLRYFRFMSSLVRCFIDSSFIIESLVHQFIGSLIHSVSCARILSRVFIGISIHLLVRWWTSQLRHFIVKSVPKTIFPVIWYSMFFWQSFRPGPCWAVPGRRKGPQDKLYIIRILSHVAFFADRTQKVHIDGLAQRSF